MTAAPLLAAEKRHAAALGVPGSIVLAGTTYPCRLIATRGTRFEDDGGQVQERRLTAIVLQSQLPASVVIDATTGATRTQSFTSSGSSYRIAPDGVQPSPLHAYWLIQGTQVTTR